MRLKKEGFIVLNETPKKGVDNKLVVFLRPKSTNGVLIELCQEINRAAVKNCYFLCFFIECFTRLKITYKLATGFCPDFQS